MRSMLLILGAPASAIRLEANSRNTAENAQQRLGLIQAVGANRVSLVTAKPALGQVTRKAPRPQAIAEFCASRIQ